MYFAMHGYLINIFMYRIWWGCRRTSHVRRGDDARIVPSAADQNPNGNLLPSSCAPTSQDFLLLSEASRQKATKRGYGFPFDSTSRGFKHTVTVKGFPFEDMQEDTMKLKHTLIASVCFQWGCGSGLDLEVLWECGQRLTESEGATVGHNVVPVTS